MNRRALVVVFGAVVVLTALVGGGLVVAESTLTSYFHSYSYRVTVDTGTNLTDVTIFAPLPTHGEETLSATYDGARVVRDPPDVWLSDNELHTPKATNGSADWSVKVVETENGPMVALKASNVEAGTYVFGSNTQLEPGRIHTADPWTSDFVLTPASDVIRVECPSWADETERCYTFGTRLYADYEAPIDSEVTVAVSLHGQTDWGFVMANGWNWFDQQASVTFDDRTTGWVDGQGSLEGGEGTYP